MITSFFLSLIHCFHFIPHCQIIGVPPTGKAALKRVFLGVGWAATPGQRIDVDCCCAPFAKGLAVAEDTVWFGNLRSRDVATTGDAQGFCTVKHSGDVLGGQPDDSDGGNSGKPGLTLFPAPAGFKYPHFLLSAHTSLCACSPQTTQQKHRICFYIRAPRRLGAHLRGPGKPGRVRGRARV